METTTRRLSEREASSHLGLSVRTLQDWRQRRTGPAYSKVGRRVVYDRADLDAVLAAGRVVPASADEAA